MISTGSSVKYYVILRTERGLKLYLNHGYTFGIVKKYSASWSTQANAETAAMMYTYSYPPIIGKLEVVIEEEGDEQDLSKFTIEDLAFAFGNDCRTTINASPIKREY